MNWRHLLWYVPRGGSGERQLGIFKGLKWSRKRHILKLNSLFFWADGFKKLQDVERDEFVNENFRRGFPELRKKIIKKKVSAQVMSLLLQL